jgi:catechol 2,3-dioxygenase-like lactoylglutathione lyase family enzyme
MSSTQSINQHAASGPAAEKADLKLEVVVIPVSDVDRARHFYESLGWRLDADFVLRDVREGVHVRRAGIVPGNDAGGR